MKAVSALLNAPLRTLAQAKADLSCPMCGGEAEIQAIAKGAVYRKCKACNSEFMRKTGGPAIDENI